MKYRKVLLLAVFVSLLYTNGLCIMCIDNNGQPVDWYIAYKVPKLSDSQDNNIKDGKGFYYMDEHDKSFTLQTTAIDDINTPMANTLNVIYSNPIPDYIMYNDHNTSNRNYGHMKGVVATDSVTGFLLLHSVPNFPPSRSNSNYSWPSNGYTNGQILLCISFQSNQYNAIVSHIMKSRPYIYDRNPPQTRSPSLLDRFFNWNGRNRFEQYINSVDIFFNFDQNPYELFKEHNAFRRNGLFNKEINLLSRLLGNYSMINKRVVYKRSPAQYYLRLNLPSVDYLTIQSFKNKLFGGYSKPRPAPNEDGIDIYEYLADLFNENIRVQSWQNGEGIKLNSTCDHQYKVENLDEIDILSTLFPSNKDHSKWAKTVNANSPIVCIGSLNRMKSQFKRGGNTICLWDVDVWNAFETIEHSYIPC